MGVKLAIVYAAGVAVYNVCFQYYFLTKYPVIKRKLMPKWSKAYEEESQRIEFFAILWPITLPAMACYCTLCRVPRYIAFYLFKPFTEL